ncbi:MAG: glycerate dehydrogenase [Arcobacter sp.]|nr:glycerate dehydrogenase [Arcobacter sp.]|tara:strand:- start:4142 stop:5437 length:1296 start_codon:yes stop_codon:yes gene_type:complete
MQVKKILKDSFFEVLKNIEPKRLINNKCIFKENEIIINDEIISLPKDKKIHLFGSGKAVLSMALGIYENIEDKIEKAVLVGPYKNSIDKKNLTYLESSHPIPNNKSLIAAEYLKESMESLEEDDFFIYLLSGGTSALIELPVEEISMEEFQETTDLMLKGSMPIVAMNCIRKHLSQVKAGRLVENCKAKGIVLVLSDVISNDLEAIGSAPLYCDTSSFQTAVEYLEKYDLLDVIPKKVKEYLSLGQLGKIQDTPKTPKENIKHFLIASNEILLNDIKKELHSKNITASIIDKKIEEDVDIVVEDLLSFIQTKKEGCFIFGGEALVKVTSNGKGGRNQHLILSFLNKFPIDKTITILSAASDGIDGNSNSAGAVINKESLEKAKVLNLDIKKYLKEFNSNEFFEKTNDLINTGPSHNNMLDVLIINIEKQKD